MVRQMSWFLNFLPSIFKFGTWRLKDDVTSLPLLVSVLRGKKQCAEPLWPETSATLLRQADDDDSIVLTCEDLGRMFDNSLPICSFVLFQVKIRSRTLIPLFRPGFVHNGSVSWDNWFDATVFLIMSYYVTVQCCHQCCGLSCWHHPVYPWTHPWCHRRLPVTAVLLQIHHWQTSDPWRQLS